MSRPMDEACISGAETERVEPTTLATRSAGARAYGPGKSRLTPTGPTGAEATGMSSATDKKRGASYVVPATDEPSGVIDLLA